LETKPRTDEKKVIGRTDRSNFAEKLLANATAKMFFSMHYTL